MIQQVHCPNFNHRRSNAPVRFCPNCGDVVNQAITIGSCSREKHSRKRKSQLRYCPDCGEKLIA